MGSASAAENSKHVVTSSNPLLYIAERAFSQKILTVSHYGSDCH